MTLSEFDELDLARRQAQIAPDHDPICYENFMAEAKEIIARAHIESKRLDEFARNVVLSDGVILSLGHSSGRGASDFFANLKAGDKGCQFGVKVRRRTVVGLTLQYLSGDLFFWLMAIKS